MPQLKLGNIFGDIPQMHVAKKCLKDNKHNNLHLALKICSIFVLGHYLFLEAQFLSSYALVKLFASQNR